MFSRLIDSAFRSFIVCFSLFGCLTCFGKLAHARFRLAFSPIVRSFVIVMQRHR